MFRGGSLLCEDVGGDREYSRDALPLVISEDDLAEFRLLGAYLDPAAVGAGAEAGVICIAAGYEPYRSVCDVFLLSVGEPETFANGPASAASRAELFESASESSPVTKLLNLLSNEPDTFSMLGFPIHDALCTGICLTRFDRS